MDAIKGRRSIRKYKTDPVPQKIVRGVLEAGIWAPSAKNGQQWRFTVLMGDAKKQFTTMFRTALIELIEIQGKDAVGSALGSCQIMKEAPVNVIIWNAGEYDWTTEEHSVAAAIQNILLRAYEQGLGSLWIGDVYAAYEAIIAYFDSPWKLSGAIALGYPATEGRIPSKMSLDQVTEFHL